jgi:hypothetical protein
VSDCKSAAGAAIAAAISTDSQQQLAQLQNDQQQLLAALRCLSPSSPATSTVQHSSSTHGFDSAADGARLQPVAQAASLEAAGAVVLAAGQAGALVPMSSQESAVFVSNLAQRVMAMQSITDAICETVQAKHKEVTDLQEGFTKVGALQTARNLGIAPLQPLSNISVSGNMLTSRVRYCSY